MGSAIVNNLLQQNFNHQQFTIFKPSQKNLIPNIKYISSYQDFSNNYQTDIVVFAFKPQMAKEILREFIKHKITHPNTIFISIIAGKKTIFFENILGRQSKIVRIMPNLPTLINKGSCGYYLNSNIKKSELSNLINFFNAIGKNIDVEQENLLDVVTAISGSSPAYLFLFIKCLIDEGISLGLDKNSANKLVKQAIYGSAKMALQSDDNLESLIESVASKGGTTEAALAILQKDNQFKKIISNAAKAVIQRAKELSNTDDE